MASDRPFVDVYTVDAQILSGIDDEVVWEGVLELPGRTEPIVRRLAMQLLHDSVYYDPRIAPKAVIVAVEYVGEVEVGNAETVEAVKAELIAEARLILP